MADSRSQIIGTSNIINNIGFLGNYTKGVETDISKVIVSILGTSYVKTRDKSIVANDYVVSYDSGSSIKSNNSIGYRVLRVVSDGLLEIAISPDTDTISRIKDDIYKYNATLNQTLLSSGWSLLQTGVYYQDINIASVNSTDVPFVDLVTDTNYANQRLQFLKIYKVESSSGKLRFYANSIPTLDLNINIKGIGGELTNGEVLDQVEPIPLDDLKNIFVM